MKEKKSTHFIDECYDWWLFTDESYGWVHSLKSNRFEGTYAYLSYFSNAEIKRINWNLKKTKYFWFFFLNTSITDDNK